MGLRLRVHALVDPDLMRHFVSAQVYAFRNQSVRSARPSDHWGFAWAPRTASSLPATEWAALTGASSTGSRPRSATRRPRLLPTPGAGLRGLPEHVRGDLDGARLPVAWRRSARGRRRRSFVGAPPRSSPERSPGDHGPGAGRRGSTAWPPSRRPSSSSRRHVLRRARQGLHADPHRHAPARRSRPPRSTTRTRAPGSSRSRRPGRVTAGTRVAADGAAPVSIRLDPPTATVTTGGTATFDVIGLDQLGNEFPVVATWTLTPGTLGTVTVGRPSRSPPAAPGAGQLTATVAGATGR